MRMHPHVTAFARPPQQQRTLVTPLHNNRSIMQDDDEHDRDSDNIERAILYSPSTGNLSEYSRSPPSGAQDAPTVAREEREPPDTPTRKPLHKASGSMLKKSVSTLFSRSANIIKLSSFTPSKRSKTEQDLTRPELRSSWPDGSSRAGEVSVNKSRERSMSTPDMCSSDGVRAVWDYQPSTPSPLRKSTNLSTTALGRQRAVTTTTPVKVPSEGLVLGGPRSNAVYCEPEKRYARYLQHSTVGLSVY